MRCFIIKTIFIFFTAFFLYSHPLSAAPLIITHSSCMPPLSFMNENGKPDGILIELWNEWAGQAGKEIRFELKDWQEAYAETATGRADINGGMFYSAQRAGKLLFGDYLFHMRGTLFASAELVKTRLNLEETTCGVLKEGYAKFFMEQNYPYTPLMLFNSIDEMFQTAAEGRLKLFVADYPVARYQLRALGIEKKFSRVKDLYTRELYPAVSKNKPELILEINKFMAAIPKERKRKIIQKWLDLPPQRHWTSWLSPIFALLALLILAVMHRPESASFFKRSAKGRKI